MDANPKLVDDFVDELKPRAKRYQLAVASDFLICVRPDGTKQWLYASPGHKNKGFARILGTFPRMKFTQAQAALASARRTSEHQAISPSELELLSSEEDISTFSPALISTPSISTNEAREPLAPNLPAFNETMLATTILNTRQYFARHRGSLVISLLAATALVALMVWWVFIEPAKLKEQSSNAAQVFSQIKKVEGPTILNPRQPDPKPAAQPKKTQVKPKPAAQPTVSTSPAPQLTEPKAAPATTTRVAAAPMIESPKPVSQPQTPKTAPAPAAQPATQVKPTPTTVAAASNYISRMQITNSIVDREPVDKLGKSIELNSLNSDRISLFTELTNLQDQRVIHRWIFEGTPVADIPINVGSARWRAYSNKTVSSMFLGQWRVEVLSDTGQLIRALEFELL